MKWMMLGFFLSWSSSFAYAPGIQESKNYDFEIPLKNWKCSPDGVAELDLSHLGIVRVLSKELKRPLLFQEKTKFCKSLNRWFSTFPQGVKGRLFFYRVQFIDQDLPSYDEDSPVGRYNLKEQIFYQIVLGEELPQDVVYETKGRLGKFPVLDLKLTNEDYVVWGSLTTKGIITGTLNPPQLPVVLERSFIEEAR